MTVPTEFPPVTDASPADVPPPVDTRGRRLLLAVLWVVFALWVAALLAMYAFTVYPHRHPKPADHPIPAARQADR